MGIILRSFKSSNEDYITLPVIRTFVKKYNIQCSSIHNRNSLIEQIEIFGSQSQENKEIVLSWVDNIIAEGIKDVHLYYMQLDDSFKISILNETERNKFLKSFNMEKPYICSNTYGKEYSFVNANYTENSYGPKLKFILCRKLVTHDTKSITKTIDYPVIVEYYLKSNWLKISAKPKSNLYLYEGPDFSLENAKKTTSDKEIKIVKGIITKNLKFKTSETRQKTLEIKNKIFNLIDKYTKTPEEIESLIRFNDDKIKIISDELSQMCDVSESSKDDVIEDLTNLIEKYMSINWRDKDVFTKDRDAYSIKLSATDEEESKVEQTAALHDPLQTKAIFFDNKKMLYKNRMCEGVTFMWKRSLKQNFPNKYFTVIISSDKEGKCVFKFREYTTMEDIENVLFSIINS